LEGSGFPRRRRWRRVLIDTAPLRESRDFRLLWVGEIVSQSGSQIARVAVYVQVFAITDSAAAVGLVGLVQVAALALAALVGGPLIDRHDRRTLLLVAEVAAAASSSVLLVAAVAGSPPLAVVYVGAGLVMLFSSFCGMTRSAMTPNLVRSSQLPSAYSLNQAMFSTTLILGPAIGGLIIDEAGLAWAYGVDVLSFTAAIVSCVRLRPQVPIGGDAARDREERARSLAAGWHQITEGFRFLRGRRVLQSTFYVDLFAMVFGMPRALFPVLAVAEFGASRGARGSVVGLLFSAVAVGALVGALFTGWARHVRRQGLAVLWAVAVWGAAIVGFGLSGGSLAIAVVCLALGGAADVVSAVFRTTILQDSVPDNLRGRMSAVHMLVVAGGPGIGDVEAGVVASLTTPVVSVVSGGLVCIAGVVLLAVAVPEFARYRAPALDAPS
jgi:MFS family permease